MAMLIRLLGDDSPLADQMCEGKIKGAEARRCLFKERSSSSHKRVQLWFNKLLDS